MARITGVDALVSKLRKDAAHVRGLAHKEAVVGFSAPYAIYVHEDLEARHAPGKQAKFLETPARVNAAAYGRIIKQALWDGKKLPQALLLAAQQLLRDAQAIVPVATGKLKSSGHAKLVG